MLRLFDVDINAFAVAGAMIIFIMGLEMVLDVDIFQNRGPKGSGSFVPLAFPMFAGPGAFAALLSITTKYAVIN